MGSLINYQSPQATEINLKWCYADIFRTEHGEMIKKQRTLYKLGSTVIALGVQYHHIYIIIYNSKYTITNCRKHYLVKGKSFLLLVLR